MDTNYLKQNYGIAVRPMLADFIERTEHALYSKIKIRGIKRYPHFKERLSDVGGDISQMPAEYIGEDNLHTIYLTRGIATEATLAHEVLHAYLFAKGYKNRHVNKCIGFSPSMHKTLAPFLMGQLANLFWHEIMYPIFTITLQFPIASFSKSPDDKYIQYFRGILQKPIKDPALSLYRSAELKIGHIADTRPYISGNSDLCLNLAKEFYPSLEKEMPNFLMAFKLSKIDTPICFLESIVSLLNILGVESKVIRKPE